MAGWLFVFCYRNAKDSHRFLAYEGQSGSKDRGDPEVV